MDSEMELRDAFRVLDQDGDASLHLELASRSSGGWGRGWLWCGQGCGRWRRLWRVAVPRALLPPRDLFSTRDRSQHVQRDLLT